MTYTFEIDPSRVLGVAADASLEQIRDAYRALTKKYHPDHGGDEWAFRMVVRSYEVLGRARVAHRAAADDPPPSAGSTPRPGPSAPPPGSEGFSDRAGVRDRLDDPTLLVDVDLLLLRFEVENPYDLIAVPDSERNLSCNLDIVWPSALADHVGSDALPVGRSAEVAEAFETSMLRARPTSSREDAGPDVFRGWLTYPSARRASDAFTLFRQLLQERGLGVNQRIREIIIPRDAE